MKLTTAIVALAALVSQAGAAGLHPNIEDRRENDTTLQVPVAPYIYEGLHLPQVPVDPRQRAWSTSGAAGCAFTLLSFRMCAGHTRGFK
jgi:hypothetical protein